MVVNARVDDCCSKVTEEERVQCLAAIGADVTSTLVQFQAAHEACLQDDKQRMRELWDGIIKQWTAPGIIIPVPATTVNANLWPLLTPDEKVKLDFIAPRVDPCTTTTTMIVGESVVVPNGAGNATVQQTTQSSTGAVSAIVNGAEAPTALSSCEYLIEDEAEIEFKVGILPNIDVPVRGSITLVGLQGDANTGWSSLVGGMTMKLDAPQGLITLTGDTTNPDNKLTVDANGVGWLRLAMSVDSEYPYRPGMNGQVFWFTWPVVLQGGGTSLKFQSNGSVEGTEIVPVTAAMAAGVLKTGVTFPIVPTPPDPSVSTGQCNTSLGNPLMRDRADWIMQGIYGSLFGLCPNTPYQ
jgi:hypothetical protein